MMNDNFSLFKMMAVAFLIMAILSVATDQSFALDPARVLIVYNSNWPNDIDKDGVNDSMQVAKYYAKQRGISDDKLLGVACSTGTNYYYYTAADYFKFISEIVGPVKNKLNLLGPTNIDVILLTYGVPYTVKNASGTSITLDNALMEPYFLSETSNNIYWYTNPYFQKTTPSFGPDKPFFNHTDYKIYGTEMYLVSRIDGPRGLDGALNIIDQAIYGEYYISPLSGYYNGNAYVDSRYGINSTIKYNDPWLASDNDVINGNYNTYGAADKCMAYAEHFVNESGFPLKWENTANSLEIGEAGAFYSDATSALTAPRALFYGGWYNYGTYHNVFTWLPGSVACDLNSNSLGSLRDPNAGAFGTQALNKGATCVSGVTSEPYLTGHPKPDVLYYYILKGYSFAEASTLATPSIGWMPINIGDPLYAPLKPKTPVIDTDTPALVDGYPIVKKGVNAASAVIGVYVRGGADTNFPNGFRPKVAKAEIEYGTTTDYGATVSDGGGYWSRHEFTLTGLQQDVTYHYRIKLTNPDDSVVTLPDDHTFIIPSSGTYPLDIYKNGTGTGTVKTSPIGIDCGPVCSIPFYDKTAVSVAATASADSIFTGWAGACTGTSPNCYLSMNAAKNATATFRLANYYFLTVAKTGAGIGSISSYPSGISCGTTCAYSFKETTSVMLTATPSSNMVFTGWSGACIGTATTCSVVINSEKSVTANFEPIPNYTLAVSKRGTGNGTITSSPVGIDCGATCSASFADKTSVTLTAYSDNYSNFGGWTGACSGSSNVCTVSLTAAKDVTALFNLISTPRIKMACERQGGCFYSTFYEALSAAPAGVATTFLTKNSSIEENVVMNKCESITIRGGYDDTFATQTGMTTIIGSIAVECGALSVDNIIIQ